MRKIVIDLDPGIADATAAVLALLDPELDVLALTATGGAVPAALATRNLHALVAQVDPPKWPRIGAASNARLLVEPQYAAHFERLSALNGPTGLADLELVVPELHHQHQSSRLMIDTVKANPHQVVLLTLGPLTNVQAACERAPDFLRLLAGLVCLGGAISVGGDITPAAEMNVYLDPEAARSVVTAPEAKTVVPLDVTNDVVLTFEQFDRIATKTSAATSFLRKILPYSFRAHHQLLGREGIWLREVTALAAVTRPKLFKMEHLPVDVETLGELTRGTTVCDRRAGHSRKSNVAIAAEVDSQGVIDYVARLLS